MISWLRGLRSHSIVNRKLPGITVEPIISLVGENYHNHVYFDHVEIPKPLDQDTVIQQKLAQTETEIETCRLAFYRMAWMLDQKVMAEAGWDFVSLTIRGKHEDH